MKRTFFNLFIAAIALTFAAATAFPQTGESRTNTLKRPCPGTTTPAKVTITRAGDVDLIPCSGQDVLVGGNPIGGGGSTQATTTEVQQGTNTTKFVSADSLAAIWEQGSAIASAGTISIGEGGYFNVTGTTTITDIDFGTDKAGRKVWLRFAGALTLTHNGTTLILPTAANITTAAGDTALVISEGSDAVRIVSYQRASGAALSGSGGGVSDGDKGDITISASGATYTVDDGTIDSDKLGGDIQAAGKSLLVTPEIDSLDDVVINTPANGEVLKYNGTLNRWENAADADSGGVSDGDKGDVVVSGSGATYSVTGVRTGASVPGTCAVGEKIVLNDGREFTCSATDTWSEIPLAPGSGSSGGQYIRRNTANTAFENYTLKQTASATIEDPTASEDVSIFFTDEAITVTKLAAVLNGSSTPSVTWTIRHSTDRSGTGNEVVTSGTTTTSISTGSVVTSFNDATIPANSYIWLETTAQSGTVTAINVSIIYTRD